ncbi:hypothetical protein P8452_02932 [Trifolium repens]|nr:hypothetical protein P8452_02932 [Trifolium repens]
MEQDSSSVGKNFHLTHALLIAAATLSHYRRQVSKVVVDDKIIPRVEISESGRLEKIEKFSHYVARQIGFEDASEVPKLCLLAQEYLQKFKGCDQSIYEYLANEKDSESLYVKLVDEFERCILSYLAFHWKQAPFVISQLMSIDESEHKTKLKEFLLAATRKQRFERVTKNLKVTRVFSTLVEEFKIIHGGVLQSKEVMIPMDINKRSPVLLFMGGGAGAGKSTVLKDILKESFWLAASSKAVVVDSDAFKMTDVIYKALNSRGHHDDMLPTAELVHQSSTDAASSVLVAALNEGKDVILDGTLSWEPFVEQTIEMARNVHKYKYRMGVGYKVNEDGTINENYWERVDEEEENSNGEENTRKPYKLELVGVVCDGYLAVIRGIRRAIMTGRAVRVNSQLKSHKRFANAFSKYCKLVDKARLFSTNGVGVPPKLIGWKDGDHNLLVDPENIKSLKNVTSLNSEADSICELYKEPSPVMESGSVWNDFVLSPSRPSVQEELRESIRKIEKSITKM